MKNRGFILPALTGLFTASLLIFLSCASGDPVEGDPLEELGGGTATEPFGDGGGEALGEENLGDLAPMEDVGMPAETSGGGEAIDEFGLPSEEELAQSTEPQSDALDEDLGGGFEAQPALPADAPPAESLGEDLSNDSALNDALGLPSDAELAKAEEEEKLAMAQREAGELGLGMDGGPGRGKRGQSLESMWGGVSRIPTIPKEAIRRRGDTLNRFYFLRAGDTPDSVSDLIYGTPQMAGKLRAWNKGRWVPGKIVYYASPMRPNDSQMQSFYKERGIPNGEYTVKRGDWLSRIAKELLGSNRSWKEIAVINGLASADNIEPGQRLAVYPADLRAAGGVPGGAMAANDMPQPSENTQIQGMPSRPETPPAVPEPMQPAFQPEPQVQFAPPVPTPEMIQRPAKKQHSVSLSRFLQQELLTIVGGLVLIVLLVSLLMVNKRKRARQAAESVDDDIFGAGNR